MIRKKKRKERKNKKKKKRTDKEDIQLRRTRELREQISNKTSTQKRFTIFPVKKSINENKINNKNNNIERPH